MTLDGNRVRVWLAGRSREWLAAQLDCSRETIDRILAGKTIGTEKLAKLAKMMGCRIDDLITPGTGTAVKATG